MILAQCIFAQDLFVKQTSNISRTSIKNPQIIGLSDGKSVIVVSTENDLKTKSLLIVQYDACGEIIWSKEFTHQNDILFADLAIDQQSNILITGYLSAISVKTPFLISLNANGNINFFKKFSNTSNYSCYTYSIDVSPNNDYYIYINYNTNTAGPVSRPNIIKLNSNGSIVWAKSYDFFSWHYGFMLATSDGGTLFSMSTTFVKIDSSGNIQWMNSYNGRINPAKGIETNLGYVFYNRDNAGADPINYLMLNKNGSVRWSITNFNTFSTSSGLKRKNGNLIFSGINNSTANNGFLEVNPIDGTLVKYKEFNSGLNFSGIQISDFYEDKNENIISCGNNSLVLVPQLDILKFNDTLSLINCPDSSFTPNYTIDTISRISKTPVAVSNNNSFLVNNEQYAVNQLNISNTTLCSYFKNSTSPNLGNDTIICDQSSLILKDENSVFDNYFWSTGAKTASITVNKSGLYWLATISACDTLRDTVLVEYFNQDLLNLGADSSFCEGDSIILKNNSSLSNYLWSNSDTTAQITVKDTGLYWLEYGSKCGVIRDSIYLKYKPRLSAFSIGNDTTICPNDSIELSTKVQQENYLWSNGMTTSTITVKDKGLYWLEVNGECNKIRDSININHFPELVFDYSISKNTAFTQENIYFRNYSTSAISIKWDLERGVIFTKDSIEYAFKVPGIYPVLINMISADGCEFNDTVNLTILASPLIIPNVFTPNGDGINDNFYPFGKDIQTYQMTIFNRWGEIVFEGENTPWDGRFRNGKMGNDGTYFCTFTISLFSGEVLSTNSSVSLFGTD